MSQEELEQFITQMDNCGGNGVTLSRRRANEVADELTRLREEKAETIKQAIEFHAHMEQLQGERNEIQKEIEELALKKVTLQESEYNMLCQLLLGKILLILKGDWNE